MLWRSVFGRTGSFWTLPFFECISPFFECISPFVEASTAMMRMNGKRPLAILASSSQRMLEGSNSHRLSLIDYMAVSFNLTPWYSKWETLEKQTISWHTPLFCQYWYTSTFRKIKIISKRNISSKYVYKKDHHDGFVQHYNIKVASAAVNVLFNVTWSQKSQRITFASCHSRAWRRCRSGDQKGSLGGHCLKKRYFVIVSPLADVPLPQSFFFKRSLFGPFNSKKIFWG